jgi:hypothetical protein
MNFERIQNNCTKAGQGRTVKGSSRKRYLLNLIQAFLSLYFAEIPDFTILDNHLHKEYRWSSIFLKNHLKY